MKRLVVSRDIRCHIARLILLLLVAVVRTPAQEPRAEPARTAPKETTPQGQPAVQMLPRAPILPDSILPGQKIRIPGGTFPGKKKIQVHLRTGDEKEGEAGKLVEAERLDDGALSFDAPKEPGRYLLSIQVEGQAELPVPGELRVLPDAVKLGSVYPARPAPRGDSRFDFEIAGENFGRRAEDNVLEVVGRGAVITQPCKDNQDRGPCLRVDAGTAGRKLEVIGFPADGEAEVSIRVRVGDRLSAPLQIKLWRLSASQVRLWAVVVLGLLLGFIALLVQDGLKKAGRPGHSRWAVLFLDKLSNSYSLSKFQILYWIVVTALGYIYVFLCQTLVRGDFSSFPPIPENMPEMLGVSVGTAVAVAAATATRGSKGAGPIEPTPADFISTGGLVVGERFQFFLWTLVAGVGFLALLFLADPTQVRELPKVPGTLLYLTGVSAAGYVGGRLVRKPGPVIKNLCVRSVAADNSMMEIELQGEGLSKNATVKIDDKPMRADVVVLNPIDPPPDSPVEFCNKLKLVLTSVEAVEPWLEGMHTLTLANPDQQSASARFPLDPMTIDSVETGSTPWVVTGKNFADPTTVAAPYDKSRVKRIDATKFEITLDPAPPKGEFTLTLVSPARLHASNKVTVA